MQFTVQMYEIQATISVSRIPILPLSFMAQDLQKSKHKSLHQIKPRGFITFVIKPKSINGRVYFLKLVAIISMVKYAKVFDSKNL